MYGMLQFAKGPQINKVSYEKAEACRAHKISSGDPYKDSYIKTGYKPKVVMGREFEPSSPDKSVPTSSCYRNEHSEINT